MKNKLKLLAAFILGALVIASPDILCLYTDHVVHGYQKKYCIDKGIDRDHCDFSIYFDPYEKEHPTLYKVDGSVFYNQGLIYFALSGKCSTEMFHNPSAAPEETGKITRREYFWDRCSPAAIAISDLFYPGDRK